MELDEPQGSAPSKPNTPIQRRSSEWSILRNRNYALLFWGQLISSTGTQMQVVAVAWQVFVLTHSALALGLIGLFQAIPRIIFSLVGGMFADVLDRRKLLLVIQAILAALSAVLALCTLFHVINMVIIYTVVLVAASVAAFDFPTRQAIIPNLVPRNRIADAMPLYMAMVQLTGILARLQAASSLPGWASPIPTGLIHYHMEWSSARCSSWLFRALLLKSAPRQAFVRLLMV